MSIDCFYFAKFVSSFVSSLIRTFSQFNFMCFTLASFSQAEYWQPHVAGSAMLLCCAHFVCISVCPSACLPSYVSFCLFVLSSQLTIHRSCGDDCYCWFSLLPENEMFSIIPVETGTLRIEKKIQAGSF